MGIESLEKQVRKLTSDVRDLHAKVEFLMSHMTQEQKTLTDDFEPKPPLALSGDSPEHVLNWVGQTSILPRLSTLCFLLVVALGLRTITDNGMIGMGAGAFLGLAYAFVLIVTGWWKYRGKSNLAPVFSVCGALLMFAIIVETDVHYKSLSHATAYALTTLTGIGMTFLGYRFLSPASVWTGIIGMCVVGSAVDFPNPFFPALGGLIWVANTLTLFFTNRIRYCSPLRWLTVFLSLLMLRLWVYKSEQMNSWFFEVLLGFGISFLAATFWQARHTATERVSNLNLALPSISFMTLYWLASTALAQGNDSFRGLGLSALGVAALCFLAAWFLARPRKMRNEPVCTAFFTAGSIGLALSTHHVFGNWLWALPVISALAWGFAFWTEDWKNRGTRMAGILLQLFTAIGLTVILATTDGEQLTWGGSLASLGMTFFASMHYLWFRYRTARKGNLIQTLTGIERVSSSLLLLAALGNLFLGLRYFGYRLVVLLSWNPEQVFPCIQTLVIISGAVGLTFFSLLRKDKETGYIAIVVTILAGAKVFLSDLVNTVGIPRLLSVFAFGLTIALESAVMSRWQRSETKKE